jgi:hypothetical protein
MLTSKVTCKDCDVSNLEVEVETYVPGEPHVLIEVEGERGRPPVEVRWCCVKQHVFCLYERDVVIRAAGMYWCSDNKANSVTQN